MKLTLTQNDIVKPTIGDINTGDRCMFGRAAKRTFKTKNVIVDYNSSIIINGVRYRGDRKMKEYMEIIKLVVVGKISRSWLKPATFKLTLVKY